MRAACAEITQFNQLVQAITKLFEAHAQQIQTEKLKSIGLRNILDMQRENARRQEKQLTADVDDTAEELERCARVSVPPRCLVGVPVTTLPVLLALTSCGLRRLTRTYESLAKVESEQRRLMDKLSNSEGI